MTNLSKAEVKALAMHEIMQREQKRYRNRIEEQNKINNLSDEALKQLVEGAHKETK